MFGILYIIQQYRLASGLSARHLWRNSSWIDCQRWPSWFRTFRREIFLLDSHSSLDYPGNIMTMKLLRNSIWNIKITRSVSSLLHWWLRKSQPQSYSFPEKCCHLEMPNFSTVSSLVGTSTWTISPPTTVLHKHTNRSTRFWAGDQYDGWKNWKIVRWNADTDQRRREAAIESFESFVADNAPETR